MSNSNSMINPSSSALYDYSYSYGVTLNLPDPVRGCFVLSQANTFATLREAVEYADSVRAALHLDCTATATRTNRNNGSLFQNVVYKVIWVHDGDFNPEKVDFWHYPVSQITKERYDSMTEDERYNLLREHGAAFYGNTI